MPIFLFTIIGSALLTLIEQSIWISKFIFTFYFLLLVLVDVPVFAQSSSLLLFYEVNRSNDFWLQLKTSRFYAPLDIVLFSLLQNISSSQAYPIFIFLIFFSLSFVSFIWFKGIVIFTTWQVFFPFRVYSNHIWAFSYGWCVRYGPQSYR